MHTCYVYMYIQTGTYTPSREERERERENATDQLPHFKYLIRQPELKVSVGADIAFFRDVMVAFSVVVPDQPEAPKNSSFGVHEGSLRNCLRNCISLNRQQY